MFGLFYVCIQLKITLFYAKVQDLEVRFTTVTLEISLTKFDQCMSKTFVAFGSFLVVFLKNLT